MTGRRGARRLDVLAALAEVSRTSRRRSEASSRRWSRCSRGSTRSRRRPGPTPAACSLTVDVVRYKIGERAALGVASTFLAERVQPGDAAARCMSRRRTTSPAGRPRDADHHGRPGHRHRAVPGVPAGPRRRPGAGPAWLFFGHQREATDFFYRDEIEEFQARGRADAAVAPRGRATAPSKVYVQDRMRENAAELGAGSRTAPTSTSAATPSAWPRTSRPPSPRSAAQGGLTMSGPQRAAPSPCCKRRAATRRTCIDERWLSPRQFAREAPCRRAPPAPIAASVAA